LEDWNLGGLISERANKFLGAFPKLPKAAIGYVISVCPSHRPSAWNNWAPTGRIFMKLNVLIFRKSVEKLKVSLNSNKNNGCLLGDLYTFMIISRSVDLRMRNVTEKVVERITTYISCSFIFFENLAVYENMWKNMVDSIIRRMRIA
jgi:hypothetical protein